ncbi:MAG: PAS domain S-box protein, partial [Candidatus Thorarchaeota archaeon]
MVFEMGNLDTEIKQYEEEVFNSDENNKELQKELKYFKEKYLVLFNNSASGIAYHKIVYNSKGKPINYIITDVNPQYEKIILLKKEDVINRTATEVYRVEKPPYLDNFSKVAETQESLSFETHFKPMNKYFKISVISPKKGEFITVFEDISEKKRANQNLKESEEKFRTITEQSFMGILIIQDGKLKYINKKMSKISGYSVEVMMNWTEDDYAKMIYPEDLSHILARIKSNKEGTMGPFSNNSYRIINKKGEIRWLEDFTSKIIYKGRSANLISIIDVTDKKEADQKIKESEEKYHELVNDANSIILRWGIDGRVLFINEFGEHFFGYSKSQLVGKHVIGTIVPETESSGRNLKKLMTDICIDPESYKNNVNENITKYGRKVWISWTNKAIKDELGNLNGILSVGNDITKQRLANLKISESEDKFRTITEQSFIGIAILKDFEFKYVNQQFSDTLGYAVKEILKWNPKEFFRIVHPEDRERIIEIADAKNFGNNELLADLQFRVIKKNGDVIWLEIISKTIPFEGEKADLIATLDITEKKEAERLILEENKTLLELDKMRKDIITRVSHELKTPLTSIYGASQILLKHFNTNIEGDVLEFIQIFHRGALRLKKLVENLIDASRIETGKLELNLNSHDLVKITKECIEEMSYLFDTREISVELTHPDIIEFNVDKIRIQQVITNILSNAIKNTPKNGKIYIDLVDKQNH